MKYFALSLLMILSFTLVGLSVVQASEPAPASDDQSVVQQRFLEEQLEKLGTSEVESFWEQVKQEYGGYLPENQPRTLSDFLTKEDSFFSFELIKGFISYLFHELTVNGKLLGMIILLTVFSMILEQIQSAFESNNVSKVAYAVTYIVIFIIAINSFHVAVSYAKEAISSMVHFMMALVPMLLALIGATGQVASVSLFHPLIIFLINTSGIMIYNIILPLLLFSSILGMVSAFSDYYRISQLANLLRNISIGLLGIFLTIFLGVVSVQGATVAVADGLTIRAAKFITSNFVPIVGRMFTDATDTVLSASLLIKNTIGLAGVIILIVLAAFPALKILTIGLIFNISAAVLQPLGNGSVITCLNVIGKNLLFVFAALATVCLMFFLGITIIIAAGNIAFMVR